MGGEGTQGTHLWSGLSALVDDSSLLGELRLGELCIYGLGRHSRHCMLTPHL